MPSSRHPPRSPHGTPAPPPIEGIAYGVDYEDRPFYLLESGRPNREEWIVIDDDNVWDLEDRA